jgi:phage shock protein PspC (stress-responsive transcriptional regulator)
MKKFYRKPGIIAGVCEGLEEYTGISAWLFRLAFLFLPIGLWAYLIIVVLSEIDEF